MKHRPTMKPNSNVSANKSLVHDPPDDARLSADQPNHQRQLAGRPSSREPTPEDRFKNFGETGVSDIRGMKLANEIGVDQCHVEARPTPAARKYGTEYPFLATKFGTSRNTPDRPLSTHDQPHFDSTDFLHFQSTSPAIADVSNSPRDQCIGMLITSSSQRTRNRMVIGTGPGVRGRVEKTGR